MSKSSQPDLKKFMLADKRLFIHLQGGRKLREETTPAQKHLIGIVVVRGNSVVEVLEAPR
ncbi:hypothetical protein DFH08DRAFT_905831 [Mycena albidolilacea]|uniref:Uncharacterized protein n=1 Tax=Mycena albidolilacea TaxID=1033008 RepID=A0AAD6Z0A7_9AGAR|nr:hypothetical protein DFH08DRAFT_905831 [Mycena albidolilacea]